jgi:hypothetical protein
VPFFVLCFISSQSPKQNQPMRGKAGTRLHWITQ